jgi:hypothetical protein
MMLLQYSLIYLLYIGVFVYVADKAYTYINKKFPD